MQGAPVSPVDPPHTISAPAANLVESCPRRGTPSSTLGSISPIVGATGAPSGMPMSMTVTAPAWALPGLIHSPGLPAWKVTGTSARTASPAISPVVASTPLGTSQANTSASPATSLMATIAPRAGSRGSPLNPVPRIASTTAAAPFRAPASNGRAPGHGSRSKLTRASPLRASPGASSITSTSRPASRSSRATTRPSPPLLPLPATATTRPPGPRPPIAAAGPAPGPAPGPLHGRERGDPPPPDGPRAGAARLLGPGQGRQPGGHPPAGLGGVSH